MKKRKLDHEELRHVLIAAVEAGGGGSAWAEAHGMLPSQVSRFMHGRRPIPDVVAAILGYRVIRHCTVLYEKI